MTTPRPANRTGGRVESTIAAVAAEGALERIMSLGVDPEDIVRDVGLELADFGDPTNNISLAGYCRLLEVAAQRTARVAQRDVLEASLAQ